MVPRQRMFKTHDVRNFGVYQVQLQRKWSRHIWGQHTNKNLGECIMRNSSTITIEGVLLVKGLKHNLLSVSQLCDNRYSIVFYTLNFLIKHKESKSLVF